MDASDLFNLLIVGGVIFGPMLAKMKMANKAKGLGQSGPADAGTGLGRTPPRPAARAPRIQPAESRETPRRKILPAEPTVKVDPRATEPVQASPVPPAPCPPAACPPPRRSRWTRLQEAVVLREMLDRPVALREGGGWDHSRG